MAAVAGHVGSCLKQHVLHPKLAVSSDAAGTALAEILCFTIPPPPPRLELWPGFVTSILQYERSIMLGLDISHKILRTDTVYEYMNDIYNSGKSNFYDLVTKGLVGEIVLTR